MTVFDVYVILSVAKQEKIYNEHEDPAIHSLYEDKEEAETTAQRLNTDPPRGYSDHEFYVEPWAVKSREP
ncbi:MAG: hypothetical protein KOO63_03010 [Bacteroidales bacterium]|nr:hypothetical protein [Candidatus Latescibacterota bacterium]